MNFSPWQSSQQQQNALPHPPELILASQSVGRKMLLEKLGVRFRVVVSRIDEDAITDPHPLTMLKKRAAAKADAIVKRPRIYAIPEEGKSLVITADSMAIVGTETFGKARDREDAKQILKALMGRIHAFTTAVCVSLVENGSLKKRWDKTATTRVTLRRLTPAELESYVARYDFTRFAAGYALGETPWDLVTKIDGSYTNVIGLPFEVLLPILRSLKIIT